MLLDPFSCKTSQNTYKGNENASTDLNTSLIDILLQKGIVHKLKAKNESMQVNELSCLYK